MRKNKGAKFTLLQGVLYIVILGIIMKHKKNFIFIIILIAIAGSFYAYFINSSKIVAPNNKVISIDSNHLSNISWILQYHFLPLVESNSAALSEFSKANKIYAVLSNKESVSGVPPNKHFNLVPTVYFNSYDKFASALSNNKISTSVKAAIFDDSSDTPSTVVPTVEAKSPYLYDQKFSSLAHQHGMVSMCDYILGKRIGSKIGEAPPCDVALLNYSQQSERSASKYKSVVSSAIETIRKTNPNMPVIVGLSTNPRGPVITANELLSSINATLSQVNGYWISIPNSGGVGCPDCSQQNPSLLPTILEQLN